MCRRLRMTFTKLLGAVDCDGCSRQATIQTGASFRVRGPGWLIAEYGSHLKGYAAAGRRIVVVTDVRNDSPADARTSAE